jgi:hypothetical protein
MEAMHYSTGGAAVRRTVGQTVEEMLEVSLIGWARTIAECF